MQHIESISVMPAVTGTLRATAGQAIVEDITKDGVALNPDGRVTLDNVAKQACRKLPKKTKKCIIKMGTWNVRTLLKTGKLHLLLKELEANDVDIVGLSEIRWQ